MKLKADVFLSVLILASINGGTIHVEHPEVAFKTSAIFGKPSTPTPEGVYLVSKATHAKLGRLLIFKQEGNSVWAIHENLRSRSMELRSSTPSDNYLSNGCIGVAGTVMDKLWASKQALVLQVY